MQIEQLVAQLQCKMVDGSVITVTTPQLSPDKNMTIDELTRILMSLGEDPTSVIKRKYNVSNDEQIITEASTLSFPQNRRR